MAPIPVTFDESTHSTIDNLNRRLKDLGEFQVPRLRKCTGPLAAQQRLSAELRDDLDACVQRVDALAIAVDDQSGELNRKELKRIVTGYKTELATLRRDSRAALLASKQAIDASSAASRDELLRSASLQEKPSGATTADDVLMKANNNVTEALQRTMALMQGELAKSTVPIQMLEESSASLRAASSQHDTLSFVMGTSKQLVLALERSDWLDRMLILAGLAFFSIVVLFVLKQRIVDRGIRIAFWWMRFLPDSSGVEVLNKVERGEPAGMLSGTLTSLTATAVTTVASSITSLASSPLTTTESRTLDETSTLSENITSPLLPSIASDSTFESTPEPIREGHDEL